MDKIIKDLKDQMIDLNNKGCFDGWKVTTRQELNPSLTWATRQSRGIEFKVYYTESKQSLFENIMDKIYKLEKLQEVNNEQ